MTARAQTFSPDAVGAPDTRSGVILLGGGLAVVSALAASVLGPAALALPFAGLIVYLLLRYPLTLYVAFLYIGLFKGQGVLERLPVDSSLILGLLLGGVCLYRLAHNRFRLPPMLLALPV